MRSNPVTNPKEKWSSCPNSVGLNVLRLDDGETQTGNYLQSSRGVTAVRPGKPVFSSSAYPAKSGQ